MALCMKYGAAFTPRSKSPRASRALKRGTHTADDTKSLRRDKACAKVGALLDIKVLFLDGRWCHVKGKRTVRRFDTVNAAIDAL